MNQNSMNSKHIITISSLFSIICSLLLIIGFLVYQPKSDYLGASVTELNGTDTMSAFPTTYNANLNALNNSKIEISTTTLPNITTLANLSTVGTIGTGTWNADTLTVAYGGTGTTTMASSSVLLGNDTNGIKTVVGLGSSGQALISNGSSLPPTWQSVVVNQSDNYSWTGNHSWSATTTFSATTTSNIILLSATSTEGNAVVSKAYVDTNDIVYYSIVCGGLASLGNDTDATFPSGYGVGGQTANSYAPATTTVTNMYANIETNGSDGNISISYGGLSVTYASGVTGAKTDTDTETVNTGSALNFVFNTSGGSSGSYANLSACVIVKTTF